MSDERWFVMDAQVRDMAEAGAIFVEITDDRYTVSGRFLLVDVEVDREGNADLVLRSIEDRGGTNG